MTKYQSNEFGGFGIDKCKMCGLPTRDHEMKPCPLFKMDTIIGQPLPRVYNKLVCAYKYCNKPVVVKERTGFHPKYCSRACGQNHNAWLHRESKKAYEEAR